MFRVRLGNCCGVPRCVDFLYQNVIFNKNIPLHCENTYDENVNPALQNDLIIVRCCVQEIDGWKGTYCSSVGHDVCDILCGIHRISAVRALLRNVLVIGYDEREALAVNDMPMERVELRNRYSSDRTRCALEDKQRHTWIQDIESSVRSMSDTGKLK